MLIFEGGGDGKEQPALKTSVYGHMHFRERRVVMVAKNNFDGEGVVVMVIKGNQPQKQACLLVFKEEGWWCSVRNYTVTTDTVHRTHTVYRLKRAQ